MIRITPCGNFDVYLSQYKFIVDGNWMTDPANPRTETTWGGHVNSVLFVR